MKNSAFVLTLFTLSFIVVSKNLIAQNTTRNPRSFIRANWDKTTRFSPIATADIIALPYPYTVPSIADKFDEIYYWDTYYTNVGLILDGHLKQAINNTNNIIYMVDKYGYMANGNRIHYLNNTQPPHLSMMVKDVFEKTKDKIWLRKAVNSLNKEYNFWMTKRLHSNGLNFYNTFYNDSSKLDCYKNIHLRLGKNFKYNPLATEQEKLKIGTDFCTEYECGWDLSPRFLNRASDFNALDLNCFLYMYEINFYNFYKQLGLKNAEQWLVKANQRKMLINKYCYNVKDGFYYDYDFVNKKQSPVLSSAIFNVLWSKLATTSQASNIRKSLTRLEVDFGIVACAKGFSNYNYQWDYPNGWAPLHFIAIKGLANYGFISDAKRIAQKYRNNVKNNFIVTGNLWEKYNVVTGNMDVKDEYKMPTLMGWTAGVYVFSDEFLNANK